MTTWKTSKRWHSTTLLVVLIVALGSNCVVKAAEAQQPASSQFDPTMVRPDPISSLFDGISRGVTSPKLFIDALMLLNKIQRYEDIPNIDVRSLLVAKAGTEFAVANVYDVFIDVVIESMVKEGYFRPGGRLVGPVDQYVLRELLITAKNLFFLDIKGQLIDSTFIVAESWEETVNILDMLPPEGVFTREEQEYYSHLYAAKRVIDAFRTVKEELKTFAKEVQAHISNKFVNSYIFSAIQASRPLVWRLDGTADAFVGPVRPTMDSSQVTNFSPQDNLTIFEGSFSQTFSGTFSQAPDFPSSPGGDFLLTFSGTRHGALAGSFNGTDSGRFVDPVPGFFIPTLVNEPFSGSSSGSIRGFNGQALSGNMTTNVTIPQFDATATRSGPVTINPNGSLSHSYSGTTSTSGVTSGGITGTWTQTPIP